MLKLIPREYFDPEEPGVLRILSDSEWRGIGITQSLGWEHYEVHGESPISSCPNACSWKESACVC